MTKISLSKIPESWEQVTFRQSLGIVDAKDTADILSVFLGLEAETLRKAKIINLNEALERISFLDTTNMPALLPTKINGYPIPKDLDFQTICRYEDLKRVAQKCIPAKDEKVSAKHLENFVSLVGIYAMPNYEDASLKEQEDFSKQFFNSPCGEVMAIGNFTLMKLTVSKVKGLAIFLNLITQMRKLRLVLKSFSARLGFSLRFFIWKKKHRIDVTNS